MRRYSFAYKNAIEKFAKFFVRYISILKSSSSPHKYKFGISPTPIGLIVDKRIEFKIGKNSCSIDIIEITLLFYRAIITSLANQKSFDVNSMSAAFAVSSTVGKIKPRSRVLARISQSASQKIKARAPRRKG